MTDKKLKHMLQNAYYIPESDRGRKFVIENEKRSRQLYEVIKNEFRYMGIKSFFAGVILCALFIVVAAKGDGNMMWVVSSIIPISCLLPMTFIIRSQKHGMCELEAASRFSLKFIRLIRMLILGIFSSMVLVCGSIFLRKLWTQGILDIVMYMFFPYFLSVWGCLFISRKWHGKDSSLFVPLFCAATGFLPTITRELRGVNFTFDYIYVVLVGVIAVGVVREGRNYINERSNVSWSL